MIKIKRIAGKCKNKLHLPAVFCVKIGHKSKNNLLFYTQKIIMKINSSIWILMVIIMQKKIVNRKRGGFYEK